MAYPSLEQYNQAFQAHSRLLTDPELQRGTVGTSGLGLPLAISGGFALTYTITAGANKYAVRCFHRESKALERRYGAISRRIDALRSPYFLDFKFQPQGIHVNGGTFPIVKMAWAKGVTLGEFIESNLGNSKALANLESALLSLGSFLEKESISHGDLQTGNLMVSGQGSAIQLIDYDGMYVDEIRDLGNSELGHVNFQHPERKKKNPFNPGLDRFSLISLSIALKAIREVPGLWNKTNSNLDAIIFSAKDFVDPASSATFALLSSNQALSASAANFAAICKSQIEKVPSLADFISARNLPKLDIILSGITTAGQQQGYLGVYAVLSATDYNACLNKVGDKVEVIGCITEIREAKAINNKPYIFINFGSWRGDVFKVAIWSEGLTALGMKPDASWKGKWVSVIGLMEPPYKNKKYNTSHLSISITAKGQMTVINESEAKWRLTAPRITTIAAPSSNREALEKIHGTAAPSSVGRNSQQGSAAKTTQPISTSATSSNQDVLGKIRAAQMVGQTTRASTPPPVQSAPPKAPPAQQAPKVSPPPLRPATPPYQAPRQQPIHQSAYQNKPKEKGVIGKLFSWLFG